MDAPCCRVTHSQISLLNSLPWSLWQLQGVSEAPAGAAGKPIKGEECVKSLRRQEFGGGGGGGGGGAAAAAECPDYEPGFPRLCWPQHS